MGGGRIPRPGEITLAHRGVLFLDELPEYTSQSLETLRQPLEDRIVTITRASGTLSFPANFVIIAVQNPCPCGYYGTHGGDYLATRPIQAYCYGEGVTGGVRAYVSTSRSARISTRRRDTSLRRSSSSTSR